MIRRLIKASLVFTVVLSSVFISFLAHIFAKDRKRRLFWVSRITSFFSNLILKVLGVRVYVRNHEKISGGDKNYLIVSNHLSYIDIFVISSIMPSIFIASVDEVADKFTLGTIAKFGGSVFIERRSRTSLSEEIEIIAGLLRDGLNVVLFPEGTTSNGEHVLSFKAPFLTPAIKSNIDILPVCIKYSKIDGECVNEKNRDLVFYYGDMKFFGHFFKILSIKSVDIELIGLENIKINPSLSRKEVANLAFDSINIAYRLL